MSSKRNIILVDDHQIVLEGLQSVLSDINSHTILPFSSPLQALKSPALNMCDLILLDLSMEEMDGFGFIKEIRKTHDIKILIFTNHGEIWNVSKLLKENISGIIHKNDISEHLEIGVLDVLDGNNYYSPIISKALKLLERKEVFHLAPREKEVLELAAQGLIAKEIAVKLEISPLTVPTIYKKICLKLDALNIIHAVNIAKERGYL